MGKAVGEAKASSLMLVKSTVVVLMQSFDVQGSHIRPPPLPLPPPIPPANLSVADQAAAADSGGDVAATKHAAAAQADVEATAINQSAQAQVDGAAAIQAAPAPVACAQTAPDAAGGKLCVRKSLLVGAGLGLFAGQAFAKGDIVCVYRSPDGPARFLFVSCLFTLSPTLSP